jgi:hypothetical protein
VKKVTGQRTDVGYLEACGGGGLSLDLSEVARFSVRYDRVGAVMLPVDSSRSLIASTLETYQ